MKVVNRGLAPRVLQRNFRIKPARNQMHKVTNDKVTNDNVTKTSSCSMWSCVVPARGASGRMLQRDLALH
jgi:hypothetical protein